MEAVAEHKYLNMRIPDIKFHNTNQRMGFDEISEIIKKAPYAVLEFAIHFNRDECQPEMYPIRENTFNMDDGQNVKRLNSMQMGIIDVASKLKEVEIYGLINSYLDDFMVIDNYYLPMEIMQLYHVYYIRGLIFPKSTLELINNL